MAQVIRNFISNALKFTPTGGRVTVNACFVPDTPEFGAGSGREGGSGKEHRGGKEGTEGGEEGRLSPARGGGSIHSHSGRGQRSDPRVACDDDQLGRKSSLRPSLRGKDRSVNGRDRTATGRSRTSVEDDEGTAREGHISGHLRVSVTDSGAGISKEDQAKLFNGVVQFRPEVRRSSILTTLEEIFERKNVEILNA